MSDQGNQPYLLTATHAQTLTANTVSTFDLGAAMYEVEVLSLDGSAVIYFTVDGSTPTVGGSGTYVIPAVVGERTVQTRRAVGRGATTVVKLISAGTPTVSVSGYAE